EWMNTSLWRGMVPSIRRPSMSTVMMLSGRISSRPMPAGFIKKRSGWSGRRTETWPATESPWPSSASTRPASTTRSRSAWCISALLDAVVADHLAHAIELLLEEFCELFRRGRRRDRPRLDQLVAHHRVGERGADRLVELGDDCGRRLRRREQSVPVA